MNRNDSSEKLLKSNRKTNSNSNNKLECDDSSNEDDYDYIEIGKSEDANAKPKSSISSNTLMPHDKNAINFLVNEYLLEQNFKMTSVTFSEENESQDLEDWDVVGLNRSKPPSICQLYKFYLNKKNEFDLVNKPESKKVEKTDFEMQTDLKEFLTNATNTDQVVTKDFESHVNFDQEAFEVNLKTSI